MPREVQMRRTLRDVIRTNAVLVLAGPLAVLVIIGFNMLELLEKHHPKLVQSVYFGFAALALAAAFYLFGRFINETLTDDEDDPDNLWPRNRS
jgi:hypothetical protein